MSTRSERYFKDADNADKLARMMLADGDKGRAEFWRDVADKRRVDATRAMERQLPKGWSK